MSNSEENLVEKYDDTDRASEEKSMTLKKMFMQISPQLLREHGGTMLQHFKDLQALNIRSRTYLEALSMKYDHNSDKFTKLLRGAERRLDRQLDDLSIMRRALIMMPPGSLTPDVIKHQQNLLAAISAAQNSFDLEIDRLYDL